MNRQDFNDWLDENISDAKWKEGAADNESNIEQTMYWFGRWKALSDVKEQIANMSQ